MAGGIQGFKADGKKLQKDVYQGAARSGRAGNKKSIVSPSGDNASPTGGSKVMARRKADQGGSNMSSMQSAIGGPFGGQKSPMSKGERISKLPS